MQLRPIFLTKLFLSILLLLLFALALGGCDIECPHINVEQTVIPPSCDEAGKTLNKCLACGEEFYTDTVEPLGHVLDSEIHKPTCDTVGYEHVKCSVCGVKYDTNHTQPVGHSFAFSTTAPTHNEHGYSVALCNVCGFSYAFNVTAPTGHKFEASVTYATSAKQNGSTTYSCSCGFSYVGDFVFYSDIFKGAYVDNTNVLSQGVDTSYHNHVKDSAGNYLPLDWAAIKAAGNDFAILRAGYIGVKDATFEMDYRDARAAGLELGAYFYSYADSVKEAHEEALFCLDLIKGKQFEYPIFFDIEDSRLELLGKDKLTEICVEFISTLQENGYYGALYTNNKWLTTLLNTDKVTTLFDIWYARFPSLDGVVTEAVWNEEKYGQQMAMWQFSQTGVINGITNADGEPIYFDFNYAYKDYPTLIKELGYNGFQ